VGGESPEVKPPGDPLRARVKNEWRLIITPPYAMDYFTIQPMAYPGILFGGGVSTNSVEDRGQRERGSGGGSPLIRGSGESCNFVQEISFHIVRFS